MKDMESRAEQQLYEKIRLGEMIQRTVDTKGWQEIIEPMIDKMIIDTIGGKQGDTWNPGIIRKCKKDETVAYYIGYKQFGVDLHNRVMAYIKSIGHSKDALGELEKSKQEPMPMAMSDYGFEDDRV